MNEIYIVFLVCSFAAIIFGISRIPLAGLLLFPIGILFISDVPKFFYCIWRKISPSSIDIAMGVASNVVFVVFLGVGLVICLDMVWPCEKFRGGRMF